MHLNRSGLQPGHSRRHQEHGANKRTRLVRQGSFRNRARCAARAHRELDRRIESIYTHDPNGYMVELTRPMRPVTPQEDLDANLTIDALLDVVAEAEPTLGKLLARKAELIVERAAAWEQARR